MVRLPPKKGPRREVACQTENMNQNIKGNEPDADLDALVHKLNEAIEDARSKMTDKQRQEADRRADAILERASSSASVSRHIA